MPKNEFSLAFNEVLEEKQLSKEMILGAIEFAMVSAYRRAVNASAAQHVEAKIDSETGKVMVFAEKEVVEDVQEPKTEVLLMRRARSTRKPSWATWWWLKRLPRILAVSPPRPPVR